MSAQENFRASISRIAQLEPTQGGVTPPVTSASLLPKAGSADGFATQRFAAIMNADHPASQAAAGVAMPAVATTQAASSQAVSRQAAVSQAAGSQAAGSQTAGSQAAGAQLPASHVTGVSSVYRSAAAQHVALAESPLKNADMVRQRFIDTMNSAQKLERGDAKAVSHPARGAAAGGTDAVTTADAAETDGEAKPAGVKGGISSLFGKISEMHAELDRRVVDPASYSSAASMIGLQRMTGMYSIYFETLSKAVFKVVRDADTFMKSSA
ncbi:hypothetical protein [Bordetella sp. LUAb4]|uniref:hypothetical protein n=1 Tax=Bordetella sp. LUAb4 TaxID=2843195 RepID=UPI001E47C5BE|nr:hypothetical protein [Bordetella sp. LUAb4]